LKTSYAGDRHNRKKGSPWRYTLREVNSGKSRKRGSNPIRKKSRRNEVIYKNKTKTKPKKRVGINRNLQVDMEDCPGTGTFLERRSKENDEADLEINNKEFDFQGNLARLDMSAMKEALDVDRDANVFEKPPDGDQIAVHDDGERNDGGEAKNKSNQPAYKCENFFDTLSTDRDTLGRSSGAEIRDLDTETFGKIGSTYRCKKRWVKGWRGNFKGRGGFRGKPNLINRD